jgi:hypothetical protein
MTLHEVKDLLLAAGAVCAVLHTFLPPWDWDPVFLVDFPRARFIVIRLVHNRWYKLIIYIVGYFSGHARSAVWRSISMPEQIRKLEKTGRIKVYSAPEDPFK